MKCGVYAIRNKKNGKFYVGSAVDVGKRWSVHKTTLARGKHHSMKLQRAWNKYGPKTFAFEVLIMCPKSSLAKEEQKYIDQLNAVAGGYNVHPVARSSLGSRHTKAARKKMSEAAIRIASDPLERSRRSERAKTQHETGNFGQITWTRPARYNPRSAIAGTKALNAHIAEQTSEEMSRRAKLRKRIYNRWTGEYINVGAT